MIVVEVLQSVPAGADALNTAPSHFSEQGVRLAQYVQVGPCVPVRIQLARAEIGPNSGPT